MEYCKIADTNINVSKISFGAEWMVDKSQEEVTKLVKYCEENGINFLDCWMSNPDVRSKLGNAIKENRNQWYIQGHIGSTWQNNQYVKTRNMSKVKLAFDDLLTRLQTDYIDFGMIHYVDKIDDYEEIMNGEFIDYVHKLKEDNIIHHIGLSTHNLEIAKLAAKIPEIELIMFSLNPAFDMMPTTDDINDYFEKEKYAKLNGIQPERQELYDLCEKTNTAITVMKAYAGGRLFKKEESPFGIELTPVQCLEYALKRPAVASVFVGVHDTEQLDDALSYLKASDDEKDYSKILTKAPKSSYLGQCTYCGHCAPCIVNINIAMVNKFYDLAKIHEKIPESIKQHYDELDYHASDCTSCGDCTNRCPFGVNIPEVMSNASKLFEK